MKAIGRYQVEEQIGRGGMGVVYRCTDPQLNRTVAIKLLAPHLDGDDDVLVRFRGEAALAARVTHPNIATLYDFGEVDGQPFFVMEYIAGNTLRHLLKQNGPLPLPRTQKILGSLADALDYAHSQGVFHRDLKPANILLDSHDKPTIIDFGLARFAQSTDLTAPELLLGTPKYMSPEQIRGEKSDGRSDLYALGLICYEMLAGQPPFQGETPSALMQQHLASAPPALSEINPTYPQQIADVLDRMLAKNPSQRFESAHHFVETLGTSAAAQKDRAYNGNTTDRTVPNRLRFTMLGTLLAASLIGALVFGMLFFWDKAQTIAILEPTSKSTVATVEIEDSRERIREDAQEEDQNGELVHIATSTPAAPTPATSTPATSTPAAFTPISSQSILPISNRAFVETFDGSPESPIPWRSPEWDIAIHARDSRQKLKPLIAAYGSSCESPPATHVISAYADAVYQCAGRLLTAIDDNGYGVIYLTPNRLLDFSEGEAIIQFDISAARASLRDWWDIWITPYDEHLQLPLPSMQSSDLQGSPQRAIHLILDQRNIFFAELIENHTETTILSSEHTPFEQFLEDKQMAKNLNELLRFELRISATSLRFGLPDHEQWWIDTPLADLGWTEGVVQFGHHSFDSTKCDLSDACSPNTWVWDNIYLAPTIPFSIIHADRRTVDAASGATVYFDSAAPAQSHVRFSAWGANLEVSFDDGKTWQVAQKPPQDFAYEDHAASYFTPMPAASQRVMLRGDKWYDNPWFAKDFAIWSRGALGNESREE